MPRSLPTQIEHLVVLERLYLYNRGLSCGAPAIRRRLESLEILPLPSVRSIHRILSHNGLTHRRTGCYPDTDPSTPLLPPVGLS